MNVLLDGAQMGALLAFAEELADAAGAAILPHFRAEIIVEDKSAGRAVFDPVTVADRAAERAMRDLIAARYPDHGIVGEEEGIVTGSSPMRWVLDPIDGTRAFVTGLPIWGTLIALNDGHRPVLGVIDQPFTRERFVGTPSSAWCNDRPIRTRRCTDLGDARVMLTVPAAGAKVADHAVFDAIAKSAQIVRFGGDCYAYGLLAHGLVDLVLEAHLDIHDVQALIPVVEGAGGVITTWEGGDPQNGGSVIACGDPALHRQLLSLIAGLRAA
ncbi:histidinol-phosphatase [Pseudoduganella albidiflava]|uniref:Histidinol-phosphatase n=2 Tax=Pseudoduganella albidiflava TaxID=321983 RepID=A0ABX5RYZ0_9BURK|nr:histidinol-phosphatase [Pseudoduganella albidiflava]QBI03766.1 histidinol-phosphatase [Pseudoduganella albidiflava]